MNATPDQYKTKSESFRQNIPTLAMYRIALQWLYFVLCLNPQNIGSNKVDCWHRSNSVLELLVTTWKPECIFAIKGTEGEETCLSFRSDEKRLYSQEIKTGMKLEINCSR